MAAYIIRYFLILYILVNHIAVFALTTLAYCYCIFYTIFLVYVWLTVHPNRIIVYFYSQLDA